MDADNADLARTFEGLIASMKQNAANIRAAANAQGIPIEQFATVLESIQGQIEQAEYALVVLRSGALDEEQDEDEDSGVSGGGVAGPFFDADGRDYPPGRGPAFE